MGDTHITSDPVDPEEQVTVLVTVTARYVITRGDLTPAYNDVLTFEEAVEIDRTNLASGQVDVYEFLDGCELDARDVRLELENRR